MNKISQDEIDRLEFVRNEALGVVAVIDAIKKDGYDADSFIDQAKPGDRPEDGTWTNRRSLEREIGDFDASVLNLGRYHDIEAAKVQAAMAAKYEWYDRRWECEIERSINP